MRPFWKCLIVSKTLVRTKLKFCSFWGNWGLISIFGPVGPKSNPHKFSSLKLLILDETILEITYCKSNFGKNKLEFLPFWGVFELISIFWVHWTKIKGHKSRHYGLLGVLNTLLALFHTGETDSGKKPYVS